MGVWETGDGGQGTRMGQWRPRQLARLGLPVTSPRPGQLTGGALCLSHTTPGGPSAARAEQRDRGKAVQVSVSVTF